MSARSLDTSWSCAATDRASAARRDPGSDDIVIWAFDVGTGPEFVPASTYTDAKRAFTKILLDRLPRLQGGGVENLYVEVCS